MRWSISFYFLKRTFLIIHKSPVKRKKMPCKALYFITLGPEFEVVSMTQLNYHLTPIEYEVFAIETLMRNVE